jgi:hypothetical protein
MSSSTSTVDYRVRIYEKLTPNDKQAILLAAGFEAGDASTIAQRGPADFWAALAQRGKELDESIWEKYPACLLIIRERTEQQRAASPPATMKLCQQNGTLSHRFNCINRQVEAILLS